MSRKIADPKRGWHALRTITVRELIETLEDEDPEAPVVFACDYGDYHHTQQVLALKGECEEQAIEESAYSHSGWAIRRDEDEDEDEPRGEQDPKAPVVLVIK